MSDFPKWMLALAGTNLIPLLICPLFMFGGLHPFGVSEYGVINFLFYLLTNLLWVVPFLLFFVSLHLYRRCFETPGVIVAVVGLLITIGDILLLVLA